MALFSEIFWLADSDRSLNCMDHVSFSHQMKDRSRFLYYWGPVLLYATLILVASSVSRIPGPPVSDKWLHFAEYSVFSLLLCRALKKNGRTQLSWRDFSLLFAAGLLFAALDEYYQSFVPGRNASISDWWADVAGILGIITFMKIYTSREQTPKYAAN